MDIKERLTHKLGPLPVWAWMGIAGGATGLILMRAKGSGGGNASGTGSSSGAGAPYGSTLKPTLPIPGSELPIIDDPAAGSGVLNFGPVFHDTRVINPTTSIAGSVPTLSPDAGKLALTDNPDGTRNLVKIGTKGDTQALPFENLVNPLLNPLINLLNKVNPVTGVSPLAAQSAKEASQVAPNQVGTGVPVGYHADGSPILIYFKANNPYAPVLTTPAAPAPPNVIANSPISAAAPQAVPAPPIWNIPGVDALGNPGFWNPGDANTAPSFHPS